MMSNPEANSDTQATAVAGRMPPLSTEEVSQLLLASSLSATRPLIGIAKLLVNEGILDGDKLKSFLTPMLVTDGFPPATKAMLDPIWKSLLHQLDDIQGKSALIK